ncbi:MAG TPA: ABC transporter permease [Acidobacteriota bacterium]|nr:ABC transporter permease [Acidobacteriota bacterium]
MLTDLRFAARSLWRRPLLTGAVGLTLALGIGANAAVFSLIDALMLRPFPVPGVERLVMIYETLPAWGADRIPVAVPRFLVWREQEEVFQQVEAHLPWQATVTGLQQSIRVQAASATPGFLGLLGARPALGRLLTPSDLDDGATPAAVLSHAFWIRHLSADPQIVGDTINLNGRSYEIAGVAQPGFEFPRQCDIWLPLRFSSAQLTRRDARGLGVAARLAEGVSRSRAQAALDVLAAGWAEEYPESDRGRGAKVVELSQAVVHPGAPPFLSIFQAAVVIVLLVACVNVAGLLLVRGSERAQELSLRQALGARRGRLLRQLMIENALLALIGAAWALPLAWAALEVLRQTIPPRIRRFVVGWDQVGLDWRTAAFAAAVGLAAVVVFGLLPAISSSRASFREILNRSTRTASRRMSGRRLLVTAEVALTLTLLIAAGLAVQGTQRIVSQDQGYRPQGLLTLQTELPGWKYRQEEQQSRLYQQLLDSLAALPSVELAAAVNFLPASNSGWTRAFEVEGNPPTDARRWPTASYRVASSDYFRTLDIDLMEGRTFRPGMEAEARPVAVVSARMAQTAWPQGDPLGKRFRVRDGEWLTVIGVVGDVRHSWEETTPTATFYVPLQQSPSAQMSLALRVRKDPLEVLPAVRTKFRELDSDLPIFQARSQSTSLSEHIYPVSAAAGLMSVFGAIALLLSLVGIYGVMAYTVSSRSQEFGIRMALGASARSVLRSSLISALSLVVVGLVIGLPMAWGLGRLMESYLFGIVELNAGAYLAFTLSLALAAWVAAYIPSKRILKVDPSEALRAE